MTLHKSSIKKMPIVRKALTDSEKEKLKVLSENRLATQAATYAGISKKTFWLIMNGAKTKPDTIKKLLKYTTEVEKQLKAA